MSVNQKNKKKNKTNKTKKESKCDGREGKNKGQIPASDTFKDEHNDVEHFIRTDNVDSVDSVLRCVRSLPTKRTQKHEEIIPETKQQPRA